MPPTSPDQPPTNQRSDQRLRRRLAHLEGALPNSIGNGLRRISAPKLRLVRIPLALILCAGGVLGFLPILGFWMLPLGLILLALDVPLLKAPVAGGMVRVERWVRRIKRRRPPQPRPPVEPDGNP